MLRDSKGKFKFREYYQIIKRARRDRLTFICKTKKGTKPLPEPVHADMLPRGELIRFLMEEHKAEAEAAEDDEEGGGEEEEGKNMELSEDDEEEGGEANMPLGEVRADEKGDELESPERPDVARRLSFGSDNAPGRKRRRKAVTVPSPGHLSFIFVFASL